MKIHHTDIFESLRNQWLSFLYGVIYETSSGEDIIWVNPDDIDYYLTEGGNGLLPKNFREFQAECCKHKLEKAIFPQGYCRGLVIPGDWDKYKKEYKYDVVFKGIKEMVHSKNVNDTEYMSNIKLKGVKINNEKHHEAQLRDAQSLYNSIKQKGYNPSDSLSTLTGGHIGVNIGRHGEFIFNNDAHHRLAICKVLDINKIPVSVVVRHRGWVQTKNRGNRQNHEGEITHPDLNN